VAILHIAARILATPLPFSLVVSKQLTPHQNHLNFAFVPGTSIAVYGIFSWYNSGSLTTTYTLNETTYSSPISVTTSSPGYLNKDGEVSNYPHFRLDNLPPGTHTLLVNITEANNQSFILDYITYKPSFDTLSSMPPLSPNITGTTTSHTSSATGTSTGAIVGGVLGGVAFGVLVMTVVVLLIRRRRRAQEQDHSSSYQDAPLDSSVNYPNCEFLHCRSFPLTHVCTQPILPRCKNIHQRFNHGQ